MNSFVEYPISIISMYLYLGYESDALSASKFCFYLLVVVTSACIMFIYFECMFSSGCPNLSHISPFSCCTLHISHYPLNSIKPSSFSLFLPLLLPPVLQSLLNNAFAVCPNQFDYFWRLICHLIFLDTIKWSVTQPNESVCSQQDTN